MGTVDTIEGSLCSIWSDVLGVDDVTGEDDFFALGGTSLLALQIAMRVSETLDLDISPLTLFENPTIAGLTAALTELKQSPKVDFSKRRSLFSRKPSEVSPLSCLQQGLWWDCVIYDELKPHSADIFRLSGAVDAGVLNEALRRLADRHEILRSAFAPSGHLASPRMFSAESLSLQEIDLRGIGSDRRKSELFRQIGSALRDSFDLEAEPLLRVVLVALGRTSYVLAIVAHELICDGWSLELIVRELSRHYEASHAGLPTNVDEQPPQYFDVVRTAGLNRTVRLPYWEEAAADEPLTLAFPFEQGGFADKSKPRVEATIKLRKEVVDDLRLLAVGERCTPFMLYLAVFFILLYRYTGSEYPKVRSHAAGRSGRRQEEVIGFFSYVLPTWIHVDGDSSFRAFLHAVRERVLDLLAHADNGLVSQEPIFSINGIRGSGLEPNEIIFRHCGETERPLPQLSGVRAERILPFREGGSLVMHVNESEKHSVILSVGSESLDRATLDRLAIHHECLLDDIARNPDVSLSGLRMIPEPEQHLLAHAWNDQNSERLPVGCLHEIVGARALDAPHAIAVRAGSRELTYGELMARAGGLAAELEACGVGPGKLVGLAIEPSPELLAAMLAVLMAGGAFLSIDADLDEAGYESPSLDVLVVNGSPPPSMSTRCPLVDLSSVTVPSTHAEWVAKAEIDPDDLAVVLRSSGLGGPPKFVRLTHRALAHAALWQQRIYSIGTSDRTFHLPGLGVFAWTLGQWAPLVSGAQIVCPDDLSNADPRHIFEWLQNYGVTMATLPARLAAKLTAMVDGSTSLRTLVVHGDDQIGRGGPVEIFRQYAVAEVGGPASAIKNDDKDDAGEGILVGGSHTARTSVYVLDSSLNLLPIGAVGEIYLGGPGIGDGYVDQPELTAQTFFPDPFVSGEGIHMVKTGDLGRRKMGGAIELLGRAADETYFRGFRLNGKLRQLERVLGNNPAVDVAVATLDEDGENLIAYVVPRHGKPPTAWDLNMWVRRRMEGWILPAHYVAVDALPLRADGAPDYDALTIDKWPLLENRPKDSVQSGTEEKLTRIWRKVLDRKQIDPTDNFFQIGGDLVRLYEMIDRANEADIAMTIGDVVAARTIADLAISVRRR